ncbi:hypothetical protein OTU49_016329, partial [Cherax quadricarinatus]
ATKDVNFAKGLRDDHPRIRSVSYLVWEQLMMLWLLMLVAAAAAGTAGHPLEAQRLEGRAIGQGRGVGWLWNLPFADHPRQQFEVPEAREEGRRRSDSVTKVKEELVEGDLSGGSPVTHHEEELLEEGRRRSSPEDKPSKRKPSKTLRDGTLSGNVGVQLSATGFQGAAAAPAASGASTTTLVGHNVSNAVQDFGNGMSTSIANKFSNGLQSVPTAVGAGVAAIIPLNDQTNPQKPLFPSPPAISVPALPTIPKPALPSLGSLFTKATGLNVGGTGTASVSVARPGQTPTKSTIVVSANKP